MKLILSIFKYSYTNPTTDEVAVIDEIQMVRDKGRGWAWTRALLGLCAKEIHLCGEAGGIDLVRELMLHTGDDVEVGIFNLWIKLKTFS